ncbi:MAG: hypothetical protein J2P20_13745 [Pseudonocardia sp.]|nr:hypothetical protein [Pseudonocardia sp.]
MPAAPLTQGPDAPAAAAQHTRTASKVAELTMSKVLAGGMAAATSAIFGSYFGAFGTVAGAAFGSVATTVTTTIYQRSIERTRESVKTKVRQVTARTDEAPPTGKPATGGSRSASTPGPPAAVNRFDAETVRMDPPPRSSRRSVKLLIGGTAMIFALGLALVTGVEWAKGSPISGGTAGTSLGRVLEPGATPRPRQEPVRRPSNVTPSSESTSESEDPDDSRHRHDSSSSEEESSEPSEDRRSHRDDLLPSQSTRSGRSQESQPGSSGLLPGLGQQDHDSGGLLRPTS